MKNLRCIVCAIILNLIVNPVELKMHVTIYFRRLTVGTSRHRKRFFFYSPIGGMVQRRVILFILTIHKKCEITKIVQGLFIAIIIMIIIIITTTNIMIMRRIMKIIEMSTVFKRNFGNISPEQGRNWSNLHRTVDN